MDYSLKIDLRWVVDELLKEAYINQRDYNLVLTSNRPKEQKSWHPIEVLAYFKIKNKQDESKLLTLEWLTQWLADKADMPAVLRIDPLQIDVPAITNIMSYQYAATHHILAIEMDEDTVTIGTDQPFFTDWHDNIQHVIQPRQFKTVMLNPQQINRFRSEFYQVTQAIAGANLEKSSNLQNVEALLQLGDDSNPDANDQHIVKIVDWLLQYAFAQKASDIHLEPRREMGRIRFRIDGVLHTVYQMPAPIMKAAVARIKILGRLNVAEKRKPQDGRLKTRTPKGLETELRLSTLPTAFGEKLVMRVFDPEVLVRSFAQLGLSGKDLEKWQYMASQPNGIILVTGPTGSGKTTTLYSTLKKLATDKVNVCTVEDPIEMIEPTFNQMQVQANIELHFADAIRSLMRQDPDIIMVGEIRDAETANMAVQASLTGHLVLSTLHTNDAPSSLTRLHDLGVQPFLTAATILGVMAQRLVRTLCPDCKQPTSPDPVKWQALVTPWKAPMPDNVFTAVGCDNCRNTGYQGRIGLYETLVLTTEMKRLISKDTELGELKKQAYKEGLQPLRLAGAKRIIEGVTTMEEVMRVVPID